MKMNATKKLPHSMTQDGRATQRGEHLVPCLDFPRKNVFIGVKTGTRYTTGYLVFLGKDISSEDILKKLNKTQPAQADRRAIESFLSELQSLKIGNVVSLQFTDDDCCRFEKTADHPVTDKPRRALP